MLIVSNLRKLARNFKVFPFSSTFYIYYVLFYVIMNYLQSSPSRLSSGSIIYNSSEAEHKFSFFQTVLCCFYRVNLSATNEAKFMLCAADNASNTIERFFTYEDACCWFIDGHLLCIASGCSPATTIMGGKENSIKKVSRFNFDSGKGG